MEEKDILSSIIGNINDKVVESYTNKAKLMEKIFSYLKPKAHNAIDAITTQWKESQAKANKMMPNEEMQELLQTMVMGSIGGVGKKALRGKDAYMANLKKMVKRDTPLRGKKLVDYNTRLGGTGKTLEDLNKFTGREGDFFKNRIRSLIDD